jgi:digeranylgeranylglycerophospholipid reductase
MKSLLFKYTCYENTNRISQHLSIGFKISLFEENMFDVIVIGGNLAGASAAINAAEKGVNVALIERCKEPFFPAHCGEGIADVLGEFLELDKISCPKNEINLVQLNVSNSKDYFFKLKKHKIFIFDRNYVEKKLLEKARKKGVKLMLGVSMNDFKPPNDVILDDEEIISGRVIIDASGIACQVGRRLGLNTSLKPWDIGVCIQSRVESNFNNKIQKMWFHKPYAPFGYAWVFPINNKLANIGLGIPGGIQEDVDELLKNYINFTTNGDYIVLSTFRSCVPSGLPLQTLVKDNVMFAGDAARLTDPALGVGIPNAIFSGGLSGFIAAKYVLGELPSLEIYQTEMQYKISKLTRTYFNKSKLTTDQKYISAYKKAFTMLSIINKISPNFFQGHVAKIMRKDYAILEKYK